MFRKKFQKDSPNTIWANQFDNIANREAHIIGTGPEIYRPNVWKI